MERRQRFVLLAVTLLLCGQSFLQGHGESRKGPSVAFLHYSTPAVIVRLSGEFPAPGIYAFPDGTPLASVINMTHADRRARIMNQGMLSNAVTNGDIVHVAPQLTEITSNKMCVQERILLGIPLNPNQMRTEDWDVLPGIGPSLARAIACDRQINGEFRSIDDLARVPGMGEKKVSTIRKFFHHFSTH